MFRAQEEIINTLDNAKRLIAEKPELLEMDKEDILDALDDGSREMLGYRWGVVAYAYVDKLMDFSLPVIIETLKDIKSGVLTYEYIGYILQSEYNINLVDLLLMAFDKNLYEKILPFVESNLAFEKTFVPQKVDAFLAAYYANDSQKNHTQVLSSYAKLIVKYDEEQYLCQKVVDTQENIYYDLMLYVCNESYAKDYIQADELMKKFLKEETEICKKLSIEFVYRSLGHHKAAFEEHYSSWDKLTKESDDYWKMLIPVYADYLQKYSDGTVYGATLECLKRVANGTVEEKTAFVSHVWYIEDIATDMENILDELIKEPFEKNKQILDGLDWIYYKKLTNGKCEEVLEKIQQIFSINGYKYDYDDFFEAFDSTCSELRKEQSFLLEKAIQKITQGDESEFYFAIGLFCECIVLKDIGKNLANKEYAQAVLELVLLGLLYNMMEAKKVCLVAFQLAELLGEERGKYLETCEKELYANYPYTMNSFAEQNVNSENGNVRELALEIIGMHKKRLEHVEIGADVLDLRPSAKRFGEYQKAVWEQKKRMNQISDEHSVFAGLFSKNVMKYGKRNAFIQVGRRNEWTFQISNYAEISYELELPQEFMKDQLLLVDKRYEYMERRKQYAFNH